MRTHIRKDLMPVMAVAVIAIVGTTALYVMNFGSQDEAPQGISMITAAVVEQAGAVALPSVPSR